MVVRYQRQRLDQKPRRQVTTLQTEMVITISKVPVWCLSRGRSSHDAGVCCIRCRIITQRFRASLDEVNLIKRSISMQMLLSLLKRRCFQKSEHPVLVVTHLKATHMRVLCQNDTKRRAPVPMRHAERQRRMLFSKKDRIDPPARIVRTVR